MKNVLRDSKGNILRFKDGTPISLDLWDQDLPDPDSVSPQEVDHILEVIGASDQNDNQSTGTSPEPAHTVAYRKLDGLPTIVFLDNEERPVAAYFLSPGASRWSPCHLGQAWFHGIPLAKSDFEAMYAGRAISPLPDPSMYDNSIVYDDYDDRWESMIGQSEKSDD